MENAKNPLDGDIAALYRALPSIERLLNAPELQQAISELGSAVVTESARAVIQLRREAIQGGEAPVAVDSIPSEVAYRAYASLRSSLRPVINATGVILHTNLGRAPLSRDAIEAMASVSRSYSNLEFDLDAGERGSRHQHVEELLCRITGAEAGMAVNNNAGALLLTLATLCTGREVVISRGQLVEIGGGFRIPDVMAQSGAVLREVGTTNRTYLQDYTTAIGESTAALMRVHSSNFRVIGFTVDVAVGDLAKAAHEAGLLMLDDIGSGCLIDTRRFGLMPEPTPQESLAAGADVVLFSGDKLLGGPQAGIIVGKRDLIARVRRHPLARALRMDKATIAALNATLAHYARGDAFEKVPILRMLSTPIEEIEARALAWQHHLDAATTIVDSPSMIGGGSLPEESVPSRALSITLPSAGALEALAKRLRTGATPVVGRIDHDRLLLDPRTVAPEDDDALIDAIRTALTTG